MKLNWSDWKIRRMAVIENKSQLPNYSFDKWLKSTKDFGDEVASLVGNAKEKDKELDSEIKKNDKELDSEVKKKKEKDPEVKKNKEKEPEDVKELLKFKDDENKKSSWNRLKDIVKERAKEEKQDKNKK